MKLHQSLLSGAMAAFAAFNFSTFASFGAPSLTTAERYASSAAFQKQWALDKSQTDQRISVGQTSSHITIDGKIGAREWQDAAQLSGLIDKNSFDSALYGTHIWMTYDAKNVYFAMQSLLPTTAKRAPARVPAETLLRSRAIIDDSNVDFDDSISLDIVPRYPDGNLYNIYTNYIGTKYDYVTRHPGNAVDINWNPKWMAKSSVTAQSWNLEVAIPISAFGTSSIDKGEIWGINVGRIWRMLRYGADQWVVGGAGEANSKNPWRLGPLGLVEFEGTKNVVVRDQGMTGLLAGDITTHLQLRNRKLVDEHLTARLCLGSQVLSTQKVSLPARASQLVALKADLTQAQAGLLDLTINDEAGKILFRQQLPYTPQQGLDVDVKSFPSSHLMQAAWELRVPQVALADLSLEISLQDVNKLRPAITRQVTRLSGLKGSIDFRTSGWPNGRYQVAVTLKNKGKKTASQNLDFVKHPLPSWLGNKFGISENPPPPWSPVKERGDQVDIWGRKIQYGGQLFPLQIVNKSRPMLARPIQVYVGTAGPQVASPSGRKVSVQWLQKSSTRVTSKRVQQIGNVEISSNSYIEFDGMTWIELSVRPVPSTAQLNKLTFSIPLKKEWAELINTYDYSLRTHGKLPDGGWSGRMRPLWVGNGDGGLQFFAETDATWRGSKLLSVKQEGAAVLLQANLIDTPTQLDKPLKFAFGFITTPVKPAPPKHRDWRAISGYENFKDVQDYLKTVASRNKNLQVFDLWNQGWWHLPSQYGGDGDVTGFLPIPKASLRPSYLEKTADGYDVRRSLYGRLSLIGSNNPWFEQFGDEWMPDTNLNLRISPGADNVYAQALVSAASPSYRDFVAWGYHQLLSKHHVPGLYLDVSDVVEDNNIHHGAGVDTGYGTVIPGQNILGQRELFKRIYTMMKERDPQAMLFHHMSGHVLMPLDSFVDGQVDGENFNSLLSRNDDSGYERVFSLEQFRSEYAGQNNLGPVGVFIDCLQPNKNFADDGWKNMRHTGDYVISMVLLHDSVHWRNYMPTRYYIDIYSAFDGTGVDSSFTFVPYWRQRALALPPGVVASFYVSPQRKKAVVILLNASDKPQGVKLEIDGRKLGMSSSPAAVNLVYPPSAQQNQDSKNVTVPAYNVRILESVVR